MVTPVHRFQAVEAIAVTRTHRPVVSTIATAGPTHGVGMGSGGAAPAVPTAATGRLKCGMWASFALVTVFMAGAKFYFNTQSTGLEVLAFCALLIVVLFAGCAVSLCEAVTAPVQQQAAGATAAPTVVMINAVGSASSNQAPMVTSSGSSAPVARRAATEVTEPSHNEPPPPPYHIAVLLPPRPPPSPPSPPPAYDKAIS